MSQAQYRETFDKSYISDKIGDLYTVVKTIRKGISSLYSLSKENPEFKALLLKPFLKYFRDS